ncbi:exosortase F system-associated protein [Flavobacterium agricola]|uniref:Exosortase F system-associated protein n=1 Tax=Flavobacterium agricola TaxID=2870839 RepID=A0ABY6LZQ2_9FLAO|nr:exosortase F system-associated protein [Flavobacterium agricola]UYW00640.1 exosortase F system-associated protein [Flavobacterium agricola]
MLKNIFLKNKFNFFIAFLLLIVLILVRGVESKLFYDPFLVFFKRAYHYNIIPEINNGLLFLSYFFRYSINAILSIAIIYYLFKQRKAIKMLLIVYFGLFVVLIAAFYFFLYVCFIDWQVIFYVRRFLIQPLFLMLFVPAFLFQYLTNNVMQKAD